jgi:PAS domain S-box-containing protein
MGTPLRVLLVEDSKDDADLVLRHLTRGGYDVTSVRVETADDMRTVLAGQSWDVVISDYALPRFSGPDALALVGDQGLDMPFIMISGAVGEEMAAPILRERAHDYLTKDRLARLVPTVERELREAAERRRRRLVEDLLRKREAFFRSLIENAWDVVLVVSSDGVIRYLSPSAQRVLGPGGRARVGRRIADFVHTDDVPRIAVALGGAAQEPGVPQRVEVHWVCDDDLCLILEVVGNAYRDDSGATHIVLNARDITDRKQAEEELAERFQQLRRVFDDTVNALAATAEKRDPYTAGHQERVSLLARSVAEGMGLSEEEVEGVRVAGTLHDIGKVCVPLDTLSKTGPLTEPEREIIRCHPGNAYDILKNVTFPWPVADTVLQHHERMDGSGYPSGISGSDIIREARILAVADVVEAMASHRPYRPALGVEAAIAEIEQNKGVLYDVEAVTCCLHLFVDDGFEFPRHIGHHDSSAPAPRDGRGTGV